MTAGKIATADDIPNNNRTSCRARPAWALLGFLAKQRTHYLGKSEHLMIYHKYGVMGDIIFPKREIGGKTTKRG